MQRNYLSKINSGISCPVIMLCLCSALPIAAQQTNSSDGHADRTVRVELLDPIPFTRSTFGDEFNALVAEAVTDGDRVLLNKGERAVVRVVSTGPGAEIALVSLGSTRSEVHVHPLRADTLVKTRSTRWYMNRGALSGALLGAWSWAESGFPWAPSAAWQAERSSMLREPPTTSQPAQ